MAKRITIFTSFYSIDRAYSLTTVVESQIKMLVENGCDVDVIVTEGLREPTGYFAHSRVTLRYVKDVSRSNDGIRRRVARNFNVEEDEVKVVHHATDIPDYLGFHQI